MIIEPNQFTNFQTSHGALILKTDYLDEPHLTIKRFLFWILREYGIPKYQKNFLDSTDLSNQFYFQVNTNQGKDWRSFF